MSFEYWEEHISNGFVLANILRESGYLICFTEENQSEFHNSTYGEVLLEPLGN